MGEWMNGFRPRDYAADLISEVAVEKADEGGKDLPVVRFVPRFDLDHNDASHGFPKPSPKTLQGSMLTPRPMSSGKRAQSGSRIGYGSRSLMSLGTISSTAKSPRGLVLSPSTISHAGRAAMAFRSTTWSKRPTSSPGGFWFPPSGCSSFMTSSPSNSMRNFRTGVLTRAFGRPSLTALRPNSGLPSRPWHYHAAPRFPPP